MRTIPAGFYEKLDLLVDQGVIVWALTIEFSNGEALYLTNNNRAFERNLQTYQPFPFKIGSLSDSGDGDLPQASLTLTNVGRFPMPYLEANRFDQARVIMELAYLPDLSLDVLRLDAFAQNATATDQAVTIQLGQPDWFSRKYPGVRWIRSEKFPGIPRNLH